MPKSKKKDTSSYPEYVQRMLEEGKALRQKMYALNGYLMSDAGQSLPAEKQLLMTRQHEQMSQYSDTLTKRIQLEEAELQL